MDNAVNQHQQPAYVPPGWYPDPITGQGERYWDGIDWSREFTRLGPQQQAIDIRVSRAESSGIASPIAIGIAVVVVLALILLAG